MNKKSKNRLMRILFIAIATTIYSLFFAYIAFGQEKDSNKAPKIVPGPATLFSSLTTELFGDNAADWNLDFIDIMSNANAGRHLYLTVYNKANVQPEKQAFKETAQAFGLTLAEADAVEQGSVAPFLENQKEGKAPLTQAQAFAKLHQFTNALNEKREELKFEAELITAYTPSEIFYNGELADSGFDLVYDLQIIEQIMFNATEATKYGGEYTGGLPPKPLIDHDPNVDLSPKKGVGQKDPGIATDGSGQNPDAEQDGTGTGNDSEQSKETENSDSTTGVTAYALSRAIPHAINGDLSDPTYCLTDYGLENALNEAPANPGQLTSDSLAGLAAFGSGENATTPSVGPKASTSNEDTAGQQSPSSQSGQSSSGQGALESEEEPFVPEDERLKQDLEAAEEEYESLELSDIFPQLGHYEDKSWCFAPFCLEINFKYKTAGAYSPGETCVACEIEKINDHLSDTIKNNISSNKAPGNIFEMAKCKKSLISSPNLNIIWLQNPIKFETNASLIQSKSIAERWDEFRKVAKPFLFSGDLTAGKDSPAEQEKVDKLEEQALNRDPLDEATRQAADLAGDSISQIDLQNQIQRIVDDEIAKIERQVTEFKSGGEAAGYGEFYQLLAQEMDTMNTYFKLYKETFEEIANETCPNIQNKSDVK